MSSIKKIYFSFENDVKTLFLKVLNVDAEEQQPG